MENKITIEYLKDRMWYRALKVIYIFFSIFCYLIAIGSVIGISGSVFEDYMVYQKEENAYQKGLIDKETNKLNITLPEEKKIKTSGFDFSKFGTIVYPDKPEKPNFFLWILGLIALIPWSLFCAWLATKIPRWIFYYIVIGNVKPEK